MFYVVPNELADAINAKLDEAIAAYPEVSTADREQAFRVLVAYFNEHGIIPTFSFRLLPPPPRSEGE